MGSELFEAGRDTTHIALAETHGVEQAMEAALP